MTFLERRVILEKSCDTIHLHYFEDHNRHKWTGAGQKRQYQIDTHYYVDT